jgi:putative DNA primase/helicase
MTRMSRTRENGAGAQIVSVLEGTIRKYIALDAGLPLVLALWILATHVFECFDAFPYLAITSPTKRCGKTRLAEIIELFCANGLRTVGATPAAIFRSIHKELAEDRTLTLIIDEAEVLGNRSDRSEALREILNAGYRRGQVVLRCEKTGETQDPKQYSTYSPKVIVLIGRLNDTLADRCIPVPMRRRGSGEHVERLFLPRLKRQSRDVQRKVAQWAGATRKRIRAHYSRADLAFLEDREAELWLPLFCVCRVTVPDRWEELRAIARGISTLKASDEPDDFGVLLLRDIRSVFDRSATDRFPTVGVTQALCTIETSPWATWARGRELDARGLARLLRPFHIAPHNIRVEDQVVKGYERDDFTESWARYLPCEAAATTLQANESGLESQSTAATEPLRSGGRTAPNVNPNAGCSGVADGSALDDTWKKT